MNRYLKIRSRNHTANNLKRKIFVGNRRILLRLGSITPIENIFRGVGPEIIEFNSTESCKISGDKILMKQAFLEHNVITAEWWLGEHWAEIQSEQFPLIIKHKNSSKGKGIYYIATIEDLLTFVNTPNRNVTNYIIEKYYPYVKEYRLHVTKEGCFYTCRKMLKEDAVERWHRHDSNSVWILEDNPLFDKPTNWEIIVEECVKALIACKLDICAIDIKVQSSKFRNPKFIILETNSAPALGEITTIKYVETLNSIFNETT